MPVLFSKIEVDLHNLLDIVSNSNVLYIIEFE